MPQLSGRAVPTVLVVGVAGAVVSLLFSWVPSLWTDEAATVSAASRSLSELVAMTANIDAVHGLYYAFVHAWIAVAPATGFWLRLPSAVAVGVTTSLVYAIGRVLGADRIALVAAVIFALLPRTTWMGLEARSAAFSTLLVTAATLLLLLAGRRGRLAGWLAGYGLAVALAVGTHIYAALVLPAHGITLLLTRGTSWRLRWGWLAAGLGGCLAASPVLLRALGQTGQLGGESLTVPFWLRNVVVNQWFLGETPLSDGAAGGGWDIAWKVGAVLLAGLCWLLLALGTWSAVRAVRSDGLARNGPGAITSTGSVESAAATARPSQVQPTVAVTILALPTLIIPSLLSAGLSWAWHDNLYNARYFAFELPLLALAIAVGLGAIGQRRLRVAVVIALLLATAPVYCSQRTINAKNGSDWSQVAGYVAARRQSGDGVYFAPRYVIDKSWVGQSTRGIAVAYPDAFVGLVDVTADRTPVDQDNLTGASRLLTSSAAQLAGVDRLWVIRRHDYAYVADDDRVLSAAGFVPSQVWTGTLDVVVEYVRR